MGFSGNALMLSMFSWLAEKLIGGFFSVIMTVFNVIVEVVMTMFSQTLYLIGVSLLQIVDFIQSLFKKLVGLDDYWWGGQLQSVTGAEDQFVAQDPVLRLITSQAVLEVFLAMLIVAFVVLIISVIVQLFRLEYTTEGAQNTKGKLFGKAFKALAMFLIVPIGTVMGIYVGNYLLKTLDNATNRGGAANISGAIFMAAASDANKVTKLRSVPVYYLQTEDGYNENEPRTPKKNGDTFVLDEDGDIQDENGDKLVEVYILTDKQQGYEIIRKFIEDYLSLGFLHPKFKEEQQGGNLTIRYEYETWLADLSGTTTAELVFTSNAGSLLAQQYDIANQIDESFSSGVLDYTNIAHVSAFYSLGQINYLILYAATIVVLYVLFNAAFGLVIRLYKVAIYFMVSPPIVALMPIYETAFVEWRKAIVGTVISAYSTVVGLNLFIMMLPMLRRIQLFNPHIGVVENVTGIELNPTGIGMNRGLNSYVYLLMVIAGLFFVKELIGTLSKWIAAENAMAEGEKISKKTVSMAGKVATGAVGLSAGITGGMLKGVGKGVASPFKYMGKDSRNDRKGKKMIKEGEKETLAGETMLQEADALDKQFRNEDGTLKKGHQLHNVRKMRDEANERIAAGKEKVLEGKGFLKQEKAPKVPKDESQKSKWLKPLRKMGSGIGAGAKGVKNIFSQNIEDTKNSVGSIFRSMGYTALGIDPKVAEERRKKGEKEDKEDKDKKFNQLKIQNATIAKLDADSIGGNIDAMSGGIANIIASMSKPGGRTEGLELARALKEIGSELGGGFEAIGDEVRKLILQSRDGTGKDITPQLKGLMAKVKTEGDSHITSVKNIVETGGDEAKIAELDKNAKAILARLIKIENDKRK